MSQRQEVLDHKRFNDLERTQALLGHKRFTELERTQVLGWLSKYDSQALHSDAQAIRLPGTGNWVFDHSTFLEWADRSTKLILLEGPGRILMLPNMYP